MNKSTRKSINSSQLKIIIERILLGKWNEVVCLHTVAGTTYRDEVNADFHLNSIICLIEQVKNMKPGQKKPLSLVSPNHRPKIQIFVQCAKLNDGNNQDIQFVLHGQDLNDYVHCLSSFDEQNIHAVIGTKNSRWYPSNTKNAMVNIALGIRMLEIYLIDKFIDRSLVTNINASKNLIDVSSQIFCFSGKKYPKKQGNIFSKLITFKENNSLKEFIESKATLAFASWKDYLYLVLVKMSDESKIMVLGPFYANHHF